MGASSTAPLTQEQLAEFKLRLETDRDSAKHILDHGSGDTQVEASGQTIGRLTRMDALQLQAMSQLSRGQLRDRLRQIEAALLVMGQGTYGICRLCRQAVSLTRLEAVPEAPFCMDCQQGLET